MIEIPLRLRHRVRDANFSPTFHRYSADVGSARGVYISTCNSVTTTYTTWWFSAALLNPHTFTTRFHEQIHLGFPARAMAFLLSVTSCTVASFCGASFRQVYHESYNQLLGKYSDFSIQDNMGYRVKKKKKQPIVTSMTEMQTEQTAYFGYFCANRDCVEKTTRSALPLIGYHFNCLYLFLSEL